MTKLEKQFKEDNELLKNLIKEDKKEEIDIFFKKTFKELKILINFFSID